MQKDVVFLKRPLWFLVAMLALSAGTLQAHPFHTDFSGLTNGLVHPWLGLDHILAMTAVGFWSAQLSGRARWLVPCSFVSMMSLGAIIGFGGASIPFVEQAILCSILVLGLLIAAAIRLPLVAGMIVIGLFALFHGLAHGSEISAQTSVSNYLAGFVLATLTLHVIGLALGITARRQTSPLWVRFAG